MNPADCRDPQPIPVRLGTEAVQCICSTCRWRGPIVADRRSARQGFDAEHGTPILDAVFPPELCDLAHADRAMLHGRNMVPDERWNGLSS